MSNPTVLVQKLWNYCNILRDDGLSFHLRGATARRDGDYVEQLGVKRIYSRNVTWHIVPRRRTINREASRETA